MTAKIVKVAPPLLAMAVGTVVAVAPSAPASTPTISQTGLTFNRTQAGLPLTVTLGLKSSQSTTVDALTLAVRDGQGRNYDFPLQGKTALTPQGLTYHQTRSLPAGNYTVFGAYEVGGTWHNLPSQPLSVWQVPAKTVTFPTVDGSKEYPLTGQFASSAWTVGHSSAFPGQASGSGSQANKNDHKSDCINPSWSAPTNDGWFKATRTTDANCKALGAVNPWKTSFVTTRHADLSGVQVSTGDSLTANITIPKEEQGSWPALWTWSDDGSPTGSLGNGEVDLFEHHGDDPALTLEHTNWATTTRPNYCWNHNAFTPGKTFGLQVDFNQSSVDYWVNGVKTCSLPGVPAHWKSFITVSESVDDGSSGYHKAPASTVNSLQGFKVTDLSLWRPQAAIAAGKR